MKIADQNKGQHSKHAHINSTGYAFKSVCNKDIKCTCRMYMYMNYSRLIYKKKHHRYRL